MYTRKAVILVNDEVCGRKKKKRRADLDKKEEKRVKKRLAAI